MTTNKNKQICLFIAESRPKMQQEMKSWLRRCQDLAGVAACTAAGTQPGFSPQGDLALRSGHSSAAAVRCHSLTISHRQETCVQLVPCND